MSNYLMSISIVGGNLDLVEVIILPSNFCEKQSHEFYVTLQNFWYNMSEKSVLPSNFSAGPHGLGDPDDKTLRKVEIEVVIPKLMRAKAKVEKCPKEVFDFERCCKDAALLMVVKCREENSALKDCLSSWYRNEEFRQICTEEYLKERSEYRRTGVRKPIKRA